MRAASAPLARARAAWVRVAMVAVVPRAVAEGTPPVVVLPRAGLRGPGRLPATAEALLRVVLWVVAVPVLVVLAPAVTQVRAVWARVVRPVGVRREPELGEARAAVRQALRGSWQEELPARHRWAEPAVWTATVPWAPMFRSAVWMA